MANKKMLCVLQMIASLAGCWIGIYGFMWSVNNSGKSILDWTNDVFAFFGGFALAIGCLFGVVFAVGALIDGER